jgi:hypothetical protein
MTALLLQELEREYYYSQKQMYLRSLTEWIESHEFDYFVTFTFSNEEITESSAEKALKMFNSKFNRSIYGNRPKKQVLMFPFKEKNCLNGWHFHIFVKIPSEFEPATIKNRMKFNWCSLRESGKSAFHITDERGNHEWFTPIYDVKGVTKYVLKQSSNLKIDNLVPDLISK